MRLSIKDNSIEVQSSRRRKEQIKILEGLGEEKALHRIGLLFRDDGLQRGIAFIGAAVFDEVFPHRLAHAQIRITISEPCLGR